MSGFCRYYVIFLRHVCCSCGCIKHRFTFLFRLTCYSYELLQSGCEDCDFRWHFTQKSICNSIFLFSYRHYIFSFYLPFFVLCGYIFRNVNITLMKLRVPFKLTKAQLLHVSWSIILITYGHFTAFFILFFKAGVCVAETPKYSLLTFILWRFLGQMCASFVLWNVRLSELQCQCFIYIDKKARYWGCGMLGNWSRWVQRSQKLWNKLKG